MQVIYIRERGYYLFSRGCTAPHEKFRIVAIGKQKAVLDAIVNYHAVDASAATSCSIWKRLPLDLTIVIVLLFSPSWFLLDLIYP